MSETATTLEQMNKKLDEVFDMLADQAGELRLILENQEEIIEKVNNLEGGEGYSTFEN